MTRPSWDQRIERARELADAYPFAAEILLFYANLTAFQKRLYSHLQSAGGVAVGNIEAGTLPPEPAQRDWAALLPMFQPFLALVAREGPAPLAAFAGDLSRRGSGSWADLVRGFWRDQCARSNRQAVGIGELTAVPSRTSAAETFELFCVGAFLQSYLEYLAAWARVPAPEVRRPVCPFCQARPLVGVLRREGDGAKRSLVCSRCRTEWDYVRLACPACEEWREEKLCVYTTPQFEHVRVEACESCRTYLKTVDLTKNGLAIPEVDELAAVPLTLWADENGYQKLSRNSLGL